jgi:hypothetical protein
VAVELDPVWKRALAYTATRPTAAPLALMPGLERGAALKMRGEGSRCIGLNARLASFIAGARDHCIAAMVAHRRLLGTCSSTLLIPVLSRAM